MKSREGEHRERQHDAEEDGPDARAADRNDPSIITEWGFEVLVTPGVQLTNTVTVNLTTGTVEEVVNNCGAQVDSGDPDVPSYVLEYAPCVVSEGE